MRQENALGCINSLKITSRLAFPWDEEDNGKQSAGFSSGKCLLCRGGMLFPGWKRHSRFNRTPRSSCRWFSSHNSMFSRCWDQNSGFPAGKTGVYVKSSVLPAPGGKSLFPTTEFQVLGIQMEADRGVGLGKQTAGRKKREKEECAQIQLGKGVKAANAKVKTAALGRGWESHPFCYGIPAGSPLS